MDGALSCAEISHLQLIKFDNAKAVTCASPRWFSAFASYFHETEATPLVGITTPVQSYNNDVCLFVHGIGVCHKA